MNSFDSIMGQMTGNGDSYGESRARTKNRSTANDVVFFNSASGVEEKSPVRNNRSNNSGENYNRQLENMSASAMNNILSTYRKEIASSGLPEEERAVLKSRIRMIERELSGRGGSKSSFSASVMEDTSSMNAQEKKYQLGSSVGTSSLVFGILGFMGSALMGSKHPFMWGIAGAGAGGTMAFFMSQDKSFKLVNPIQEAIK